MNSTPVGYIPTGEERITYFVDQNALYGLTDSLDLQKHIYLNITKQSIQDNKNRFIMTIIVSISSIVLIGILVAPMLSKISERQYTSISFFLDLPLTEIAIIQKQTEKCKKSLNEAIFKKKHSQLKI